MKQKEYDRLELKKGNLQLILEFPKQPENEEHIKKEVKRILSEILQEYTAKNFQ